MLPTRSGVMCALLGLTGCVCACTDGRASALSGDPQGTIVPAPLAQAGAAAVAPPLPAAEAVVVPAAADNDEEDDEDDDDDEDDESDEDDD
jgi:ribosomal protein L12E/L44/L45/RPP1/RPP2